MVHFSSLLVVAVTYCSAVSTVQALDLSNYQIDPKITGDYLSFVKTWYGAVDAGDTATVLSGFSNDPTVVYDGVTFQGKDQIAKLFEGGSATLSLNEKLLNSTLISSSPIQILTYLNADVTIKVTGEIRAASSVATLTFNSDAYLGQMTKYVEDTAYAS